MSLQLAVAILGAACTPASASPHTSEAAVPSTLAAKVSGNRVVYGSEGITVYVPASAKYFGGERFNLYGVADAEVHVFAETDGSKRLRKLYWVQFESYLPGAMTSGYNYAEKNSRMMLSGVPTWVRSGPAPTTAPSRPGSDREHVQNILERAGILIPPEVSNVRMVQLLDDPQGTGKGMRELMIVYSEDLSASAATLAELAAAGPEGARWKAIEKGLINRAIKAVTIKRQ